MPFLSLGARFASAVALVCDAPAGAVLNDPDLAARLSLRSVPDALADRRQIPRAARIATLVLHAILGP